MQDPKQDSDSDPDPDPKYSEMSSNMNLDQKETFRIDSTDLRAPYIMPNIMNVTRPLRCKSLVNKETYWYLLKYIRYDPPISIKNNQRTSTLCKLTPHLLG